MKYEFAVGDVVYYNDNGPHDTGVIVGVTSGNGSGLLIDWDDSSGVDWFLESQVTFVKVSSVQI